MKLELCGDGGGGGVSMELQRRFMDIVKEDGLGGEMDADDPLWWFLKGETKGSSAWSEVTLNIKYGFRLSVQTPTLAGCMNGWIESGTCLKQVMVQVH